MSFKFGFAGSDKDGVASSEKDEELVWRDAEEVPLFKTPFSMTEGPANMQVILLGTGSWRQYGEDLAQALFVIVRAPLFNHEH